MHVCLVSCAVGGRRDTLKTTDLENSLSGCHSTRVHVSFREPRAAPSFLPGHAWVLGRHLLATEPETGSVVGLVSPNHVARGARCGRWP